MKVGTQMNSNFFDLESKWNYQINMRNPYVFGEEKVDLNDFAELFKQTFKAIKETKNDYINGTFPEDNLEIFEYNRFLCTLSKYTTYDCLQDESEENLFTVTCLIAEKLLHFANHFEKYEYIGNKRLCFDNENTENGIFSFYLYLEDCNTITETKIYCYDIYKGDYSEIIEFASYYCNS